MSSRVKCGYATSNSSMFISARLATRIDTGTRVPRIHGSPCRRSGSHTIRSRHFSSSLMSAPVDRLFYVPLRPEVRQRLLRAAEHLRRRLRDEGRRNPAARPDDVDFFAAFEGVVKLALDA